MGRLEKEWRVSRSSEKDHHVRLISLLLFLINRHVALATKEETSRGVAMRVF